MPNDFNWAEVPAKGMVVNGRKIDGAVVVADTAQAYGADAKTVAAMAADTVARKTQDSAQADAAYDIALEQAEQDPEARMAFMKTKAWQVKNRIADVSLHYNPDLGNWYMRYLKVDRATGFAEFRYRELTDEQMNFLGQNLEQKDVEHGYS